MMPVAMTGIQSICTAQTVMPIRPKKAKSMTIIKATPCHEKRV